MLYNIFFCYIPFFVLHGIFHPFLVYICFLCYINYYITYCLTWYKTLDPFSGGAI